MLENKNVKPKMECKQPYNQQTDVNTR